MKYAILITLLCIILAGCAETRQFTVDASKENLANAATSRQVIPEFMSTWALNVGAIECGTEEVIPAVTLRDLQRMSQIVKDSGKWSDEDYRIGCFSGLAMKLTAKQVQALIEQVVGIIGQYAAK